MTGKRVQRWREEPDKSTARKATRLPNRDPGGGMLEGVLQDAIMELCQWAGLYCYHTHDSRASVRGFPDLVIVGPTGILFRELKSQSGKVTPDQMAVLSKIETAGGDAGVWRPSHLATGTIRAELKGIGGKL